MKPKKIGSVFRVYIGIPLTNKYAYSIIDILLLKLRCKSSQMTIQIEAPFSFFFVGQRNKGQAVNAIILVI